MIKSQEPNIEAGHGYRLRSYNRRIDRIPADVARNPTVAVTIGLERAKPLLVFESLKNGGTPLARRLLTETTQLSAGFFQCIQSDGQAIRIRYGDIELETTVTFKAGPVYSMDWFKAYWLAVITRDEHSMSILLNQDPEIFKEHHTPPSNFELMCWAVLCEYAKGSEDVVSVIQEARKFYDPQGFTQEMVRYETLVLFPVLDLLELILKREGQEAFNKAMHSALLKHQEYDEQGTYETNETYVSFPLTAMAVIAYDREGYEVTVENEYILDWAVKSEQAG